MKPPRQFACAGQTPAGSEIVAQNAQNHLGQQLFADADFTVTGKLELRGAVFKSNRNHAESWRAIEQYKSTASRNCFFSTNSPLVWAT